jgi:transposase
MDAILTRLTMPSKVGRLDAHGVPSVVQVFAAAQAEHRYLFANARSTRIRLLRHDGFGVWCAAWRLNKGSFEWPRSVTADAAALTLSKDQFNALVLGLPWQRLEQLRLITRMCFDLNGLVNINQSKSQCQRVRGPVRQRRQSLSEGFGRNSEGGGTIST